jgi:hypothetical protein
MQWLRDALTLVKGRPRDQGETSQCDTLTFEEICNTLNTDNRMTGLQTIFNSKSNLHGVPATVNMVKKTLVSMSPIMLRKRKGSKAKDGEAWMKAQIKNANQYNPNKANRALQT